MITPNKIEIEGEEITDKDIALGLKETELLLKRARLKVGLSEEPEPYKSTKEPEDGVVEVSKIPF